MIPMVIFKDLKQPAAQPVQMLLNKPAATVIAVDQPDQAVEVAPNQKWDATIPLQLPNGSSHVIHAEPDKLWVDQLHDVEVGDKIYQDQYVGELTELFRQFGQEWTKRWDRHLEVDARKWDPVIAFAEQVLPMPSPMEYKPLTVADWDNALRKKSKKAATGPDGLSRADMLHWPLPAKQALVDLLNRIEQGLPWPQQMVTGFVVALEKTPGAETVNQYRPITVFSLCYRTWSSIRARQVLQHLQPLAPSTCTGNLPGKHAAHVWYGIMQEIELAQLNKGSLSGWVVDLVKAFNMLPRTPILHFMYILRVAPQIMLAWGSALTTMERRFKLHNCVGPSLRSSTGFPEGCALSVTAMLAHNLVAHLFLRLRHPSVTLWSFVDNIESTAPDAQAAVQALETFHSFSDVMDVAIDKEKSYSWSVDASQRKTLRDQHQVTKLSARDLGGHVQYSKVVTNSTVTNRCEEIKPLWGRLARSLAPYAQKVRALVAKAWPSCLHGVASAHMADDHFDKLRTGALQGLWEHSSGTSPAIHLSLVEGPLADPQFQALWQTVQMYREHNQTDDCTSFCMKELHYTRKTYVPRPGPMSVLLNRLHQIAWSWTQGTEFLDHAMQVIDLRNCPVQELKGRLTEAWQMRIQGIASSRKTFQGMQWMNAPLTMAGTRHLPAEDKALLRVCLNGTFFTADRKKHQKGQGDTSCKHCGLPDSQVHRHWLCAAFTPCRTVSETQANEVAQMMPCISAHGWMPEPPSLQPFRRELAKIPDETKSFLAPPATTEVVYAFTDGSCLAPTCSLSKLATWGAVIAMPDMATFWPLASGVVKGWVQTALRGEIIAATSACWYAVQVGKPIILWTDNDLVFTRMQRFQQRHAFFKPNQKDADLWSALHAVVRRLGPNLLGIKKICSHQDVASAENEYEEWACRGNAAADHVAEKVIHSFPAMMRMWLQLQQDISHIHILRNHVHKALIQVGRQAVRAPTATTVDKQHVERITQEEVAEANLAIPKVEDLPAKYSFPHAAELLNWIAQLTDPSEPVKCISWFQMNILYEHQTGHTGVRHVTKRKVWVDGMHDTKAVDFVRRTKYLSSWIQGVWSHFGPPLKLLHLRPHSCVVQFWTQCIALKLRSGLVQMADDILQEAQGKINSVQSLRNL